MKVFPVKIEVHTMVGWWDVWIGRIDECGGDKKDGFEIVLKE